MSANYNSPTQFTEKNLKPAYRALRRLGGDVREKGEILFAASIYILDLTTAISLSVATRGLSTENPFKVDPPAIRSWEKHAEDQLEKRYSTAKSRNKVTHVIYS